MKKLSNNALAVRSLNTVEVKSFLLRNVIIFALIAFVLFMGAYKPSFPTWDNITNILTEMTAYGVTACAMTVAIICGEFDLSASSVFCWSTVLFISMTNILGIIPAFWITLASGIGIGAFNGWLVSKVKMSAFVATLGNMWVFRGLAFFYTNGDSIISTDETLISIGTFNIAGVGITPLVFVAVFVFFIWFMKNTKFGRNIYATGGSKEVAQLSGINVSFYKFIIFVIMGACAAISGILYCTRIRSGGAIYGTDLSLYCVAATVIGGTSLSGGNGNVGRTLIGLLVMSILFNALTLLGVQGYFLRLIRGIVLITVITVDALLNKR